MTGWSRHEGIAISIAQDNIDTDQLIPARFMSASRAHGYGDFLLHDLRRDDRGALRPDFALNACPQASILIAGANFGSGSSREAAVYALVDAGITAVIAPGFGDIFASNAVNNGLLPALVSPADAVRLLELCARPCALTVDLATNQITGAAGLMSFSVPDIWKQKLINGWDDIDLTSECAAQIAAFRDDRHTRHGWAVPQRAAT